VSQPPDISSNDGWNDVVNPPQNHVQGWPTTSFPLLPPPLNRSALHIMSKASHVHSSYLLKKIKSQIQEPNPSKGKWPPHSDNSDKSIISSHYQHPNIEEKHIYFGDMHPKESTTRGKKPIDEHLEVIKLTKS
jgi:hypothetical protein